MEKNDEMKVRRERSWTEFNFWVPQGQKYRRCDSDVNRYLYLL